MRHHVPRDGTLVEASIYMVGCWVHLYGPNKCYFKIWTINSNFVLYSEDYRSCAHCFLVAGHFRIQIVPKLMNDAAYIKTAVRISNAQTRVGRIIVTGAKI